MPTNFNTARGSSSWFLYLCSREFSLKLKLKYIHDSVAFYRICMTLGLGENVKLLHAKYKNKPTLKDMFWIR
jgi:hypothetical protein